MGKAAAVMRHSRIHVRAHAVRFLYIRIVYITARATGHDVIRHGWERKAVGHSGRRVIITYRPLYSPNSAIASEKSAGNGASILICFPDIGPDMGPEMEPDKSNDVKRVVPSNANAPESRLAEYKVNDVKGSIHKA